MFLGIAKEDNGPFLTTRVILLRDLEGLAGV